MEKTVNFTKLQAVLIDLDGTLADSMPLLYNAYLHFLKAHGHTGTPEEFASMSGMPMPDIIANLKRHHKFDQSTDEMVQLYMRQIRNHYATELTLFPGAETFLNYALLHRLKLAIVTSAPRDLVMSFLTSHGLIQTFDVIMTSEDVTNGKPAPDIYLKTIKTLGIGADNALVIEDSEVGVESALQAKIPTIQLMQAGDVLPSEKCITLKDWHELLYLFQAHYG